MQNDSIKIHGARVHNLKNISVDIPRNKLVVITGISGSGKSSLAFDTLYAEGQRRYVESLSAYARQFLGVMDKPDVDKIEGISPAISIDQRKGSHNPRSTVGTITEIYDYLRLLFARIGKPHCPKCGKLISRQTVGQITDQILKLPKNTEIAILGPVIQGKKGEHKGTLEEIKRGGFVRVRVNDIIYKIEEILNKELDKNKKHNIEIVIDKLVIDNSLDKARLVDSIKIALRVGKGIIITNVKYSTFAKATAGRQISNGKSKEGEDLLFSEHFACEKCGISLPELEPRLFSFNSPYGACAECTGLGEKLEVDPQLLIPNKNLTISEGAIMPWMRAFHKIGRQSYLWLQLSELSEKYKFSLDVPIKDLSPKIIDIILHGDKKKFAPPLKQDESRPNGFGWEGVILNLEKRYHETDSDWTREEIEQYMVLRKCPLCLGKRLKPEVLAVTVGEKSISEIAGMSIDSLGVFFRKFSSSKINALQFKIIQPIIKEILNRLQFLIDVGLDYLTLDRKASTLAGGEGQRIRLATQIGSKLTGVLYILDEPSIGLHPRDQGKLIETLKKLRDLGNTVVVVEHDPQTMKAADWIIDIGPGAGKHGGRVVFTGTPQKIMKANNLTGQYLSGRKKVEFKIKNLEYKIKKDSPDSKFLVIKGAQEHNLKNINVKIPLGKFVCITGVSGSGKSSLMDDILAKHLFKNFYNAKEEPGKFKEILGTGFLNKVVLVDQSPIGRTPRSNPATYTNAFSNIRELFVQTKEAKIRGYDSGRFSFNVKGGRCEVCEGQGQIKVEMYFLPDIYVECQECKGKRYGREILEIEYKGKNISEVLEMTVEEAIEFFKNIPAAYQKLETLKEVGLNYIKLGQPATSLSGGEAQRVKLATELSRKDTGRTLYILDEPTTGLHFDDVKKLISVLKGLVLKGNTVLVIEHNVDLIKNSDWIIDLGPEGGNKGGYIVAEGSPKEISKNKKSYTGKYLK